MRLNENFNQQEFIEWIRGFLPDFSEDIRRVAVSKSFQGIKSIQTVGESALGIRVYIIETEHDPSRRKIGLATESFTLLRDYGTPNAIVVYYSENSSLWRLSLLTSTLTWNEGKIKKKLSNPKRQSYVLGSKAKVKTPHQYLISKGSVTDFTDLKSRFSLEVVNKEFYKEISSAFIHLVGGQIANGKSKKTVEAQLKLPFVKDHSQTSQEFAVRLIGRIIFCWFLREKRSASGHSLMPRELLSFEASNTIDDYYHRILEPIFFEVLNRQISTRKDSFVNDLFSAIPYLNGGLFSPHEDDFFNYNEGKQAVNHNMVIVPNAWLKTLFEVLETYNFTIDENTSFDEELSIDPEMLGRIFENLLAEINPETGDSARKSTGSYYTPRVIVDYMVDESLHLFLKEKTSISEDKIKSLISYDLEDDNLNPLEDEEKDKIAQALASIKILDPACGSGAFPIGALQKIVFILQQIDPEGHLWFKRQIEKTPSIMLRRVIEREFKEKNFDYIRKLGIIQDNIFGIDIQPIATEISRLRCFLTLVVDERVDDTMANRGIEPLPNLDFKFVSANTLVSLPKLNSLQPELFDDHLKIEKLKELIEQYFTARDEERKDVMIAFSELQSEMINDLIDKHSFTGAAKTDLTRKLTDWKPFKHKSTDWFDPEWMFGVKQGFDIVIANPPYVRHRDLNLEFKRYLKEQYSTGNTTSDLYCYFLEAAYTLSRDEGISCFITSNKWLKAKYGQKIRQLLKNNTNLRTLIDLGSHQFEAATVDTSVIIFIKSKSANNAVKYGFDISSGNLNLIHQNSLDVEGFNLASSDDYSLKEKLESVGTELSKWKNIKINYGVLTGKNEILINNIREGVFIIDKAKRDELIEEDKNSEELLKPILKGKDIGRYHVKWDSKYLVCVHYGLHKEIHKYPAIHNHLERFRQVLINRAQVKRGDHHWIELDQNPSLKFIHEFNENKVIFPIISQGSKFHYDTEGFFHNDKAFHITGSNLKYLTAILNSKLVYWMIRLYGPSLGKNGFEFRKIFIERLRIPILSHLEQKPFEEVVDKILSVSKSRDYLQNSEKREKIQQHEKQIDQMVYELYELTPDEISIVEGRENVS